MHRETAVAVAQLGYFSGGANPEGLSLPSLPSSFPFPFLPLPSLLLPLFLPPPSLPLPLPFPSCSFLRSRTPKIQLEGLGSTVSSPARSGAGAPAEIEFGALYPYNMRSGGNNCNYFHLVPEPSSTPPLPIKISSDVRELHK